MIRNKTGLHARPASVFVDLAKGFQSDIKVRYGADIAGGKSLISLLQLGVTPGSTIRVSAQGTDAATALDALRAAIASGLEDEPEQQQPVVANILQGWTPQAAIQTLGGVSASGGLAIGATRQYKPRTIIVEDEAGNPSVEGNRFQEALNAAQGELNRLY
jgi:phosphotransferase system HPr (HPr) family protein